MEHRYVRKSAPGTTDDGKLDLRVAPFDSPTVIGGGQHGFREKIAKGAFAKSLRDGDVVLLDNHDSAKPLARTSAGTLTLHESGTHLQGSATVAKTSYAQDVLENVRAGNYGGMSFGFEVVRDKWTRSRDDDMDERELLEVKLHEVSVCTFPAYADTASSARDAFDAAMEARERFYERELRAKYDAEQLKEMLAKGHAFKNAKGEPSYPIADEEDLKNAIRAVGRGGASHNAIRRYIMGRAKALGLSSLIPDSWGADGSISEAKSAAPDITVSGNDYTDMAAGLVSAFNALSASERAALPDGLRDAFEAITETRDDPDGVEYAVIDHAAALLKAGKKSAALKVLEDEQKNREADVKPTGKEVKSAPVSATRDEDEGRALRWRLRNARALIEP